MKNSKTNQEDIKEINNKLEDFNNQEKKEYVREQTDTKPSCIDGLRNAQWVAMDYSDVVVHIFLPEIRDFYNLEHLWADAKLTNIPDID